MRGAEPYSPPAPARALKIVYLIDEMEAITAGGTERQVLQMIGLMRQAGHEVQLWILRGTAWLQISPPDAAVCLWNVDSWFSASGWRGMRKLWQGLRRFRPDVVQTFFVEANVVGPILARLAGVPLVLGSRRNLNYWMGTRLRLAQSVSNLFVDRLLANGEALRAPVAAREWFAAGKIDVIHNAVESERFTPSAELREATRASLGINLADLVVGTVSAVRPVKGIDTFLEAAAKVAKQLPGARFLLVGDGPLLPEMRRLSATLGIEERVIFAGAQADVRPYLNAMDVAVLASDSEGFSNSLLEYMSAGLPAVATDVGGNREALGNAGVIVPARDAEKLARAILALSGDAAQREALAAAALARARLFSLDSTREKLHRYYSSHVERE